MSSADGQKSSRPYQMRLRAEHVDGTRLKIVEAAVRLHGTVGPAATTIAEIAETAGVTRATVYRHFPDEASLFQACSTHWLARQQVPDPRTWAAIADPEGRIRAGLADLYRFYRAGEPMLTRVYRDVAALPEGQREILRRTDENFRDVLLAGFPPPAGRRPLLRAVVGHAASFGTWRSLCVDHGLSDEAAVDAMSDLAMASARRGGA